MDFMANQWYHIKFITNPAQSNDDIYVDDVWQCTAGYLGGPFIDPFRVGEDNAAEVPDFDYGEAYWDSIQVQPIPEPSSIMALVTGILALGGTALRRRLPL